MAHPLTNLAIFQTAPIDRIVWLQADANYTWIHSRTGQRILSSRTLKWFDGQLSAFIRVNKSALVNPAYITNYVRRARKTQVTLIDGTCLPVARRRKRVVDSQYKTEVLAADSVDKLAVS